MSYHAEISPLDHRNDTENKPHKINRDVVSPVSRE